MLKMAVLLHKNGEFKSKVIYGSSINSIFAHIGEFEKEGWEIVEGQTGGEERINRDAEEYHAEVESEVRCGTFGILGKETV